MKDKKVLAAMAEAEGFGKKIRVSKSKSHTAAKPRG